MKLIILINNLLSTFYVLGTVLDAGNTAVRKVVGEQ